MGEAVYQIKGRGFCAGIVLDLNDRCIAAAPILAARPPRGIGAIGKSRNELRAIFERKGWIARLAKLRDRA